MRHVAAAFAVLATAFAVGCGGGSSSSEDEKEFDLESLNAGMAQELAMVDVYTRGLPVVRGSFRPVWRELRAQEQEYVDGITKSIRGLGGEVDAEPTEVDFSEVKSQADFLTAAYELENAGGRLLRRQLAGAVRGRSPHPRGVARRGPRPASGAVAAGPRRGSSRIAAPEAFESGELPPPGAETPPDTE